MNLTTLDGSPTNLGGFGRLGIDKRAAGNNRGGSLQNVKNVSDCLNLGRLHVPAAKTHLIYLFVAFLVPVIQFPRWGKGSRCCHRLAVEVSNSGRRNRRACNQEIGRVDILGFDNPRSYDLLRSVYRENFLIHYLSSSGRWQEPSQ